MRFPHCVVNCHISSRFCHRHEGITGTYPIHTEVAGEFAELELQSVLDPRFCIHAVRAYPPWVYLRSKWSVRTVPSLLAQLLTPLVPQRTWTSSSTACARKMRTTPSTSCTPSMVSLISQGHVLSWHALMRARTRREGVPGSGAHSFGRTQGVETRPVSAPSLPS